MHLGCTYCGITHAPAQCPKGRPQAPDTAGCKCMMCGRLTHTPAQLRECLSSLAGR